MNLLLASICECQAQVLDIIIVTPCKGHGQTEQIESNAQEMCQSNEDCHAKCNEEEKKARRLLFPYETQQ